MSNVHIPMRQRIQRVDWSMVGRPLRSIAFASLFASTIGIAGCQQLGFRNRDEDLKRMLADQDDWALPASSQNKVPRPTAQDLSGQSRKGNGIASGEMGIGTNRKQNAVVGYGPDQGTSSDDQISGPVLNTPVLNTADQEIDVDGALASLPPAYREILKKQLDAVQRQSSSRPETALTNLKVRTGETRSLSDESQSSEPVVTSGEFLSSANQPNAALTQNTTTEKNTNKISIRMTDTGAGRDGVATANSTQAKAIEPQVTNAIATSNPMLNSSDVSSSSIAQASAISPVIASLPTSAIPSPTLTQSSSLQASALILSPTAWRQTLNLAIEQLEKQVKEVPASDENLRLSQEVTLRMLYVSQRRLEDATRKIESLSNDENEYFQYQMQALYEASNPDAMPVRSRHWSLVMDSQRKATNQLAAVSNLEVKSVAFCTEVERYGLITKFPKNQFQPDQELLLYCEIENVAASKVSKEGYESQLQGSYEIIDSQGRKVADQLLPMEPEICQNHRRDYFIVYKIYVPQQIAVGNYQLRLTVEDMKAHKFGQSHIDFQVKK